jgi:biopolymer transport protein TolR
MAMGVSNGGGGGRRRRSRKKAIMSEINITPMVDVMLVLLIIFMVAAPMMTAGVPIDLPNSAAAAMPNQADPVTVGVTPEGAVFIDETPVTETDLIPQLAARGVNGAEDRIFLRGDTSANYGAVMRVMGLLSAGGFSRIGLITQPDP